MSVPGISVWFLGELTCSGMCVVLPPTLWRYQSSLQTLLHMAGEVDAHLLGFSLEVLVREFFMNDLLITEAKKKWKLSQPGILKGLVL